MINLIKVYRVRTPYHDYYFGSKAEAQRLWDMEERVDDIEQVFVSANRVEELLEGTLIALDVEGRLDLIV